MWGWWLIEWKRLFSVALLCFENGSRDAYHSHAFNSVSWVLRGKLVEDVRDGWHCREDVGVTPPLYSFFTDYSPSWKPIHTSRNTLHKVTSVGRTWVLTFRGPWAKTWREYRSTEQRYVTLTNGRVEL